MIAHLWANQSLDHARVAHGNFWFTGPALYSYGDHYVVGFHMPITYNRDGVAVALLNSTSYSPTTSKHQHAARHALPHSVQRCDVDGLNSDTIRGINHSGAHAVAAKLITELRALADKAANPRIRPDTRAALLYRIQTLRDWAFHFARCDALRCDLTKEQRARARAQMSELRFAPFASGADKAGAAAYARAVNHVEYVAKLRTVEADILRRGEALLSLHTSGEHTDAHARLQAFDRAHTQACEFAGKAGVTLPRPVASLARKVNALRADIIAAHAEDYVRQLADWRDAKPGAIFPDVLHRQFSTEPGALLRLSADRRRIETSRGAEVPTRIAGALWQAIEDRRAGVWADISRTPYAGMQLGHFRLDAVEPDGSIRAGCHFIPYAELLDIAQRLGLPHPAQVVA